MVTLSNVTCLDVDDAGDLHHRLHPWVSIHAHAIWIWDGTRVPSIQKPARSDVLVAETLTDTLPLARTIVHGGQP